MNQIHKNEFTQFLKESGMQPLPDVKADAGAIGRKIS